MALAAPPCAAPPCATTPCTAPVGVGVAAPPTPTCVGVGVGVGVGTPPVTAPVDGPAVPVAVCAGITVARIIVPFPTGDVGEAGEVNAEGDAVAVRPAVVCATPAVPGVAVPVDDSVASMGLPCAGTPPTIVPPGVAVAVVREGAETLPLDTTLPVGEAVGAVVLAAGTALPVGEPVADAPGVAELAAGAPGDGEPVAGAPGVGEPVVADAPGVAEPVAEGSGDA